MRTKKRALRITGVVVSLSLAGGGMLGASAAPGAPEGGSEPESSGVSARVESAAEAVAEELAAGLQGVYEAAFVDGSVDAADEVESLAEDLELTATGEAAIEELGASVDDGAALAVEEAGLVIDEVEVSVAGEGGGHLMQFPEPSGNEATRTSLSATQRSNVADYAEKYATKGNWKYWSFSLDCTNFVSQALRAGGWKEKSHIFPDYKMDKAWWYGGVPISSWSWSGAENFYRMTKGLGRTTAAKNTSQLRRGDILQYRINGRDSMTHSMVATKKTSNDLYLSYHTTNNLNKPLSLILAEQKKNKAPATYYGHLV